MFQLSWCFGISCESGAASWPNFRELFCLCIFAHTDVLGNLSPRVFLFFLNVRWSEFRPLLQFFGGKFTGFHVEFGQPILLIDLDVLIIGLVWTLCSKAPG